MKTELTEGDWMKLKLLGKQIVVFPWLIVKCDISEIIEILQHNTKLILLGVEKLELLGSSL